MLLSSPVQALQNTLPSSCKYHENNRSSMVVLNQFNSKDYGAFAPFKVRAGPRSYIILRDPTHISRVLNASEHLTATSSKIEVLEKLFGSPKAADHKISTSQKDRIGKSSEQTPLSVSDPNVAATTEAYIGLLSANMHDKMFQYDTWTRIE